MSDRIDTTPASDAWSTASQDVAGAVHRAREGLPDETTGWDPARLAGVVLDRNGTPTRALVAEGWSSRVAPQDLARAVLDAARAAARDLDEQARVALQEAAERRAHRVEPRATTMPSRTAAPRPLDELAEIAITSLAAASQATAADAGATLGIGRALDGEVEVTVGRGGIVAAALRGPRVAQASGSELSVLLSTAVQAAVQDLAVRRASEAPVSDELLEEVLMHLRSLTADPLSTTGGHAAARRG